MVRRFQPMSRRSMVAKKYFSNTREERLLSGLDSSKDHLRDRQIQQVRANLEDISNKLAQKLIDDQLVVTSSKNELIRQFSLCLNQLIRGEDFDVDYRIAPLRTLVSHPNFISLFVTSYVVETLINHSSIEDIYGTDKDIYEAVDSVVKRYTTKS